MANELPWFRFSPQKWQNGDIALEDENTQGVFVNIMSFYWIRDCCITLAMLERRFSNAQATIKRLLDAQIIKHDKETDYVKINFLDEQFDELSETRKLRQEAGRKGGLSNAKAPLMPNSSYKTDKRDKKKEKEEKENILKKIQEKNSGEAVEAGFTPKKQKNTLTPTHSAAPPLSLFKKALEMYPSIKEGSVEVLYDKFRDYCIKYGKDIETEVVAFKEGVHRYAMLYRKQRDKKAADPKYFYKETYSAKDFISLGRWTESFDDVSTEQEKIKF